MRRARISLAAMFALALLLAVGAFAQEETEPGQEVETMTADDAGVATETATVGTKFEATVEFAPLKSFDLEGSAGQVEVRKVEFDAAKPKGAGITNPMGSSDPEMQVVITTRLDCMTTAGTKVKFDMMVEFLDRDGRTIDRAKNSANFKNNEKTFEIKHTTLKWALDHIESARITVEEKK